MMKIRREHLRRYRDIAWLLWKHGRADWVRASGLDRALADEKFASDNGEPDSLSRDLESLGPTFIKIGQLLASRADLLPPTYLRALSRLQDDVAPVPFEKVEEVLEAELGAKPSRVFLELDERPLATASLAQVHLAKLRDGREVVVKVQRPNVEETIRLDFEAFNALLGLTANMDFAKKYRLQELFDESHRAIDEELDYRSEARNLRTLRTNLAEFELIKIPAPVADLTRRRVLVMERIPGTSISAVSPVVFTEIDGKIIAHELFAAYLKQILVDGFFHADPHPGNVFLMPDHRIGLIDVGMVGRIDVDLQEQLLALIIAISEGRGRRSAEIALRIGTTGPAFEQDKFIERVTDLVLRNEHADVSDIQIGRVVLDIQKIASDTDVRLPQPMVLVAKTLMNLDAIARIVAPDFEPNRVIRRRSMSLVKRRMWNSLTPGNLLQSTLELSEFTSQLPRRLNEVITQVGRSGIKLDVDAFDEKTFVAGFQKIANRITTGIILAAMIIGAAQMMRIETSFRLLGYPGLAILLFLSAALGSVVLLYQILRKDHHDAEP